ncbi:MAG: pyridoxamine 5-phosphate oxidase [Mycobacteriaceae bacterium]|nr:pyridoxamine 5-phosphate oxidase [Mycobacteriaceae bacterium]
MSEQTPGSDGEHALQSQLGSTERAERFYTEQMLDHLNPAMIEFIGRQDMAFIATADSNGECDSSLRAGSPGFLHVIDERTLAYPEYRGNGVMASMGNITENPHIGILLVDFVHDLIGLHINGEAAVVDDDRLRADVPTLPTDARRIETWVVVTVREAYIHCRKHIPRMARAPRVRSWGTDDQAAKGGDYFGAKGSRRPSLT